MTSEVWFEKIDKIGLEWSQKWGLGSSARDYYGPVSDLWPLNDIGSSDDWLSFPGLPLLWTDYQTPRRECAL